MNDSSNSDEQVLRDIQRNSGSSSVEEVVRPSMPPRQACCYGQLVLMLELRLFISGVSSVREQGSCLCNGCGFWPELAIRASQNISI